MNKPAVLCAFADEASGQVTEQMRALKENGMVYLEARNVDGKNIADLTPGEARTLKERLAAQGLRVWSLGSPLGKIGIEEDFAPHLDVFRRCLETAAITGAACIRLFSFFLPAGSDPALYRDEVMDRLSRFLEEAEGCPVVLCHENEKGIYGDTARPLPGYPPASARPTGRLRSGQFYPVRAGNPGSLGAVGALCGISPH